MKCHSGPAVAGEESPVIFGTIFRGNSQRCFASLNMTAPLKDDFYAFTSSFPVNRRKASTYFADFVSIKRLHIIAYKLFIETRRTLADRVFIFRPEARRIGRQTLVDQEQFSID